MLPQHEGPKGALALAKESPQQSGSTPDINDPQWQFEQLGSPSAWLRQAELLKDSGDVLLQAGRHAYEAHKSEIEAGVAFPDWYIEQSLIQYLYALSIENLLKAIILATNPSMLSAGAVKWPGDGHRLDALVTQAGVTYSDKYERQLISQQLQQFLDWGGRYPIPKIAEKLSSRRMWHIAFRDPSEFGRVFDRYRDELLALLSTGTRAIDAPTHDD
jgi:hypothetical protein